MSSPRCVLAGLSSVVIGLALLPACASKPEPLPDPRLELKRHNDEYWAYLAATYDKNTDARVERVEYSRGEETFTRLDRDRDGVLTRADLDRDLILPVELVGPMMLIRAAGGPDAKSATLADIGD